MEFDTVSNQHPHPLIFYRQGKPPHPHEHEQGIWCSKCGELFRPPAFACSKDDCNFNVHQSCLHLPREILSPFHTHPLSLRSSNNNSPCMCCGQKPYDASYSCYKGSFPCGFSIDVQCAIADPEASGLLKTAKAGGGEFRHFSHPHPLTLHLQTDPDSDLTIPVCFLCQRTITITSSPSSASATYYFCPQSICDSYALHQQCAELPRKILKPDLHPDHPLFLFARPLRRLSSPCLNCKYKCTNFFYSCPPCKFNLHVDCVPSFKHEHQFRVLRNWLSYKCQLCLKSGNSFPWLCTVCLLLAHEDCAIRQMSIHQTIYDGSIIIQLENEEIQHFSHEQHKLRLCRPDEDVNCDGCMRCISSLPTETESSQYSYACPPCGFYLHPECATLETRYRNPLLHKHWLKIFYIPDLVFSCAICLQYSHGFAYHCQKCYYAIDIRCAATTFPFTHSSHPPHPLTDYNKGIGERCKACGEWLATRKAIGCEDCKFYLDVKCANLPLAVKNRFDEHPLILTFENEDKNSNEYYCDICEEERNVEEWFYHCRLCDFFAHPNCLLGDHPFLKQAQFENHPHPLSLVNQCKKRFSCGACGDSCEGKLALECGNSACEFNVHAFGQCYHKQLITQGRITFTNNPSLRHRSISLRLDPDEMKWWKLILKKKVKDEFSPTWSFTPQGNSHGEKWDHGVFSSIRAFRIHLSPHGIKLEGMEIEYEDKDGNSIWKTIRGWYRCDSKGTKEVTLNHPDEYLISIHGSYAPEPEVGIQSLTFETNQRTIGPYGNKDREREELSQFSFPTKGKGVKIVGFHGRSIADFPFLVAIGFHFVKISIPKMES